MRRGFSETVTDREEQLYSLWIVTLRRFATLTQVHFCLYVLQVTVVLLLMLILILY